MKSTSDCWQKQYRRQGMTAEAAMLAARRQFGNTTLLQET